MSTAPPAKGRRQRSSAARTPPSPSEVRPLSTSGTSSPVPSVTTSMPGSMAAISRAKAPLRAVATVASTPTRPLLVACTASRAAGTTTPVTGRRDARDTAPRQLELTVPQATSMAFTPCESRKRVSSRAMPSSSSTLRPP